MSIKKELTRREVEELRTTLPPISDEDFDAFVGMVYQWISIQPQITPDDTKISLTPKDLKAELTKIKKHYKKAVEGLEYLSKRGMQHTLVDQHYYLANSRMPCFRQDQVDERSKFEGSSVENETRNFIKALESYESSVKVTRGRGQDKRYHFLILEIAKFFKQKLPGSAISSNAETNFSRVITYIITQVLSTRLSDIQDKQPADLKRRINDALNELSATE